MKEFNLSYPHCESCDRSDIEHEAETQLLKMVEDLPQIVQDCIRYDDVIKAVTDEHLKGVGLCDECKYDDHAQYLEDAKQNGDF